MKSALPLILFEDADLLVVHKPAGVNTHKPDPHTPDGIHEWLTKRGWTLAILHRLDKETSGVLVFGKSTRANQSLARQFEAHKVKKEYLFLSPSRPKRLRFCEEHPHEQTWFEYLEPVGPYAARSFGHVSPPHPNPLPHTTGERGPASIPSPRKRGEGQGEGQSFGELHLIKAEPVTGRTHQIRRHASTCRFPILGDSLYEGAPACRLMLHAHRITFLHPATNAPVTFTASVPGVFADGDPLTAAREARELMFDAAETDAYRLVNGAGDGLPGLVVDAYAGRLFVQRLTVETVPPHLNPLPRRGEETRREIPSPLGGEGQGEGAWRSIYEQLAVKQGRQTPRLVSGAPVTERFAIRENGVTFLVNFGEGLSTGLFLDQRENRRRLLGMPLAGKNVLNLFAYTCAFSVCAARAGATTVSVDLSKNYLEWGRANFRANDLDDAGHTFVPADVFAWLEWAVKRGDRFDMVLVDPPTFSTTKAGRRFQAERDYGALAELAGRLVVPGGVLFCSTNQRTFAPKDFEKTIRAAGREVSAWEFATLPWDYRLAEGERPYLKTGWATLGDPVTTTFPAKVARGSRRRGARA